MSEQEKTREQLLAELESVRARLAQLEQRRAEQSAKEVSGFFMGLLQHAPTPIYVKALDGRYLLVNRAWEDLFGLRQEAVVGRHVSEIVSPEMAAKFVNSDRTVVQSNAPFAFEERVEFPSGAHGHYHTVKFPLHGAAGQVKAVGGISIDISERKKTEHAVRDSEERYRLLFERNLAGVYQATFSGKLVDCNQAFVNMLGREKREELLEQLLPALFFQRADWDRLIARLEKQGSVTLHENSWRRKDGSTLHTLQNVSLHDGSDGRFLQGTVIDISERWRTRQELIQERHLLRTLMDHVPDAIYFKDDQSRFTRVNQAFARHFGQNDPAQFIGRSDFDFFTEEHARQAYEDEKEVMRTGQPVIGKEEKETWADGRETWVSTSKMPLRDVQGKIIGTFGLSRDITERKRAEEALRETNQTLQAMILASPLAVVALGFDGKIKLWNPAAERLLGWTAAEIAGGHVPDIVPPDRKEERRAFLETLAKGESITGIETRRRRKDGVEIDVSLSAAPLRSGGGVISAVLFVLADMTERKRLEEQLRQAQKMEAIGQLAGGVAHDFNNLLTAILGNVSLLLSAVPDHEPNRDLLRDIERAATRAAELTGQLLGFSRQTLLRLEPTNLNTVIRETVAILRWTIDPRITVEVQTGGEIWAVQADSGQMSQVLMNLCLNARDAMPEGGRLLLQTDNVILDKEYVRQHIDARAGEFVRLRVSDTGCGIPPDVQARIFDPFFTTKEPGKGTGLGLAMVFGIVKQHHGWIECHSEVGKGTDFDIYLPRCHETIAGDMPAPSLLSTPSGGGNETILLVDDEAIIRNLGRTILQRYGYSVVVAEDGQDALEIYQRNAGEIDLVILDLTMPRLSGRDTFHQLLSIDPNVRVLFSSGYSAEQMTEADREGVLGFVNKPYRPQGLAQTVRAALDQARSKVK
jgi:PAS domain S-box-containing protein